MGVGSYRRSEIRRLREDLARFTSELGLDLAQARVRGHWIPQGLRPGPLASRRVVLAGDAAATADALFGEGISYAILSGIAAAQTIGDWADGRLPDLSPYDARLRAALGPTLDRLDVIARAVELSVTATLLGVRLSTQVRERAVDAIAGRRAPYAIDAHCELACACELHASVSTITASATGASTRPMHGHCRLCSAACAA